MKIMYKTLVILAMAIGVTLGCGDKSSSEAIPVVKSDRTVPAPPAPTKNDWDKALQAAYVDQGSLVSANDDGVRVFTACFIPLKDGKCVPEQAAFGTRDAFRKLRFYAPGYDSFKPINSFLVTYISLKDYEAPTIFMAPYLAQANWLFMEKVAIMADGEVILEHSFADHNVERDTVSGGITERVDFQLSGEQITALRKIRSDSKIVVRIEGKGKYMSLQPKQVESLLKELLKLVRFYDTLEAALGNKIPT